MIGLFAFLIILSIAVAFIKTPLFKGWVGEFYVNLGLKLFLNKELYHQLKNVTLPCEDGTTQVDHVIVSRFGIFVIETKNMGGWIFGNERDAKWTQKFRGRSFKFQNPLRQNYKHVAVLTESLALPPEVLKSVIMFIGDATIKTQMPPNVMTKGLCTFIKSHKEQLLTDKQVSQALKLITEQRLTPGIRTHLQHVENVRANIEKKSAAKKDAAKGQQQGITAVEPSPAKAMDKPPSPNASLAEDAVVNTAAMISEEPVCPKCGRKMVMRKARSGAGKPFWGCSGFPKCRAIVPIAD